MSAPNKQYDPVEVAALSPEEIAARRGTRRSPPSQPPARLDELKAARLAHAGDRSPLALANAEIGALPPQAARRGGQAGRAPRGARSRQALAARQAELEAERDQRVLVEEAVDVTLPWDRAGRGARHPVTTLAERLADVFVAMGYEIAEGPEVEAEWYNFDALNFPPDHPAREMQDTFFVAGPDGTAGFRRGAAHAHLAGADPGDADPPAAAVRGQPGQVLPHRRRSTPRTARCSTRSSAWPWTRD